MCVSYSFIGKKRQKATKKNDDGDHDSDFDYERQLEIETNFASSDADNKSIAKRRNNKR